MPVNSCPMAIMCVCDLSQATLHLIVRPGLSHIPCLTRMQIPVIILSAHCRRERDSLTTADPPHPRATQASSQTMYYGYGRGDPCGRPGGAGLGHSDGRL